MLWSFASIHILKMLIILAGLLHGIIVAFIIIIAINDNEPKASFEVGGKLFICYKVGVSYSFR